VRELGFLLIPVVVYFAISMSSDMDIGARHLLPVYPFLYVLVGAAAMVLLDRDARWGFVLVGLLGWQVATSVRVSPAYMAYGNEAWGGPAKVDRYLGDANTDWGQQLKAVKRYLDERKITNCWFAYFPDGSIDPSDYGVNCKRLPTTDLLYWLDVPVATPPAISGTVLISAGDLEGIEFGDGRLNPYDEFRKVKPTAVIQHSVYVFDGTFAVPLAAALVEARDASKLADAGQKDAALAKAEDAARLAPWSGQVQATLGDVLLKDGKKAEALQAYETALQIEETVRPDLQVEEAVGVRKRIAELKKGGI
jgi:tetratricopeptide (TPR) repeat protein